MTTKTSIRIFLLLCLPSMLLAKEPAKKEIYVYAAASLVDTLPQIAKSWTKKSGVEVVLALEASSRLANQIAEGVPADVFISADTDWMDFLDKKKLIDAKSRKDLLSNRLVLIEHRKKDPPASMNSFDSKRVTKLALAGESVPAGKYAEASLKHLKAWDAMKPNVIRGTNVRSVLTWVTTGEVQFGVVYRSDVTGFEDKVGIVYEFPENSHPKIIYPIAVIAGSKHPKEAKSFLTFAESEEAKRVFLKAGFIALGK